MSKQKMRTPLPKCQFQLQNPKKSCFVNLAINLSTKQRILSLSKCGPPRASPGFAHAVVPSNSTFQAIGIVLPSLSSHGK